MMTEDMKIKAKNTYNFRLFFKWSHCFFSFPVKQNTVIKLIHNQKSISGDSKSKMQRFLWNITRSSFLNALQ